LRPRTATAASARPSTRSTTTSAANSNSGRRQIPECHHLIQLRLVAFGTHHYLQDLVDPLHPLLYSAGVGCFRGNAKARLTGFRHAARTSLGWPASVTNSISDCALISTWKRLPFRSGMRTTPDPATGTVATRAPST